MAAAIAITNLLFKSLNSKKSQANIGPKNPTTPEHKVLTQLKKKFLASKHSVALRGMDCGRDMYKASQEEGLTKLFVVLLIFCCSAQ